MESSNEPGKAASPPQADVGSYFAQFSLPEHLYLDLAALEKSFYTQSRRLHPDRFAARPAEEQEAALAASSRLNDAYRTLRDPIARTGYLLRLLAGKFPIVSIASASVTENGAEATTAKTKTANGMANGPS